MALEIRRLSKEPLTNEPTGHHLASHSSFVTKLDVIVLIVYYSHSSLPQIYWLKQLKQFIGLNNLNPLPGSTGQKFGGLDGFLGFPG